MTVRRLGLSATLAFSLGASALAQTLGGPLAGQATAPAAASLVGHWIYNARGNIVGSVRGLADDGRTVVVMVGSYFQPGSYEARVPARALSVTDGRATLRAVTVEALSALPRR